MKFLTFRRLLRQASSHQLAAEGLVEGMEEDGPIRLMVDESAKGGTLYTLTWGDLQGASSRDWPTALMSLLDLAVREAASVSSRQMIEVIVEVLGPALLALLVARGDDGV